MAAPASHWRIAMDLLLAIALIGVGASAARSWRGIAALTSSTQELFASDLGKPGTRLSPLVGVDLAGHVGHLPSDPNGRFIIFAVRASTGQADIAFWQHVTEQLGGSPWLHVLGFYESATCAGSPSPSPSMVLLQAGEVQSTQAVLQADRGGNALLLAANSQVIGKLPWRNGASPARVAAALAGLR